MAVAHNPSDQQVVGNGYVPFTGIGQFKVVAVNPTLEELHGLGIMVQSEPQYAVTFQDGNTSNKVVFWLSNGDAKLNVEFLVTPGPWKSKKSDKYLWYSSSGNSTWAGMESDGSIRVSDLNTSPDGRYYFRDHGTAYLMPRGLDGVTDFIRAWANVPEDGECVLDTLSAISNGDVTELRSLVTVLANNEVRCLAYVVDGKYNRVYNKYFGRVTPRRDDLFIKFINKSGNEVQGEWTPTWQKYSPLPATPSDISSQEATEDDFAPLPDLMGGDELPM